MKDFLTVENANNERIDLYLSKHLKAQTRNHIQKLIKEERVLLNGTPIKANYRLHDKDHIEIHYFEEKEALILPENIPLSILYEDEDLLIVDKPKQMVVHPAPGHYSHTLVNALLYYLGDHLSGINGPLRPGIVHRIDQDTTGALVVAKNDATHLALAQQLKEHSIKRVYEAIVWGNIKEDTVTINKPIGRDINDRKKMSVHTLNGREAVTYVTVLERFGDFTYISCTLETGRTHQIRVHLKSIGHPLLGDIVYGPKKTTTFSLTGQTLHAKILGIVHPVTKKYIEVTSPLPEYFKKLLDKFKSF